MVYNLHYKIKNTYRTPVKRANYQILIIPMESEQQELKSFKISCSLGQTPGFEQNHFGFESMQFYIDSPFYEVDFEFDAEVEIKETNPFDFNSLDKMNEFAIISSNEFYIDNHLYLAPTELTTLDEKHSAYFPNYSSNLNVHHFLLTLNRFIYHLIEYSQGSTDVDTTAQEVVRQKKGVCQDFAHVFISICRNNGIPARYVSGYLGQGEDNHLIGNGQLHAWVEALIPDVGWVAYDPTNNLLADHHYVKIAHGTDYRDCSPIKGVISSSGKQSSVHSVQVNQQQ